MLQISLEGLEFVYSSGLIWDEHMQVIFAVNLVNWVNKVN